MSRIHDVVILGDDDRNPKTLWAGLTPNAKRMLRTFGGDDGIGLSDPGRVAFQITGKPTPLVSAALAELQLLKLIEAVKLPEGIGYTLTPEGGGVLLFGQPLDAEEQKLADFLSRAR